MQRINVNSIHNKFSLYKIYLLFIFLVVDFELFLAFLKTTFTLFEDLLFSLSDNA